MEQLHHLKIGKLIVLDQLSLLESSHDSKKVNKLGYVGKYQFGAARLEQLGYLQQGSYGKYKNKALLYDTFTGKNGVTSLQAFLNSEELQDLVAFESLTESLTYLKAKGVLKPEMPFRRILGLLLVAHLNGNYGAYRYHTIGRNRVDAFGTKASDYYDKRWDMDKTLLDFLQNLNTRIVDNLNISEFLKYPAREQMFGAVLNLSILLSSAESQHGFSGKKNRQN